MLFYFFGQTWIGRAIGISYFQWLYAFRIDRISIISQTDDSRTFSFVPFFWNFTGVIKWLSQPNFAIRLQNRRGAKGSVYSLLGAFIIIYTFWNETKSLLGAKYVFVRTCLCVCVCSIRYQTYTKIAFNFTEISFDIRIASLQQERKAFCEPLRSALAEMQIHFRWKYSLKSTEMTNTFSMCGIFISMVLNQFIT